jgi:hypothetical protein
MEPVIATFEFFQFAALKAHQRSEQVQYWQAKDDDLQSYIPLEALPIKEYFSYQAL